MSQWKNTDAAGNSVIWAGLLVNKTVNTANRDALFGNVTPGAFVAGQTVGIFGVDNTEVHVTNGSVVAYTITFPGSGYAANAAVTVSGNATSNATANSLGRISAVNVNTAGSNYTQNPTVTVAAPAAQTFNSNTALYLDATFNANTGVDDDTDFITTGSAHGFANDDLVRYLTATGNTALTGLTNAATYYVVSANSTGLKLSANSGGAAVNVVPTEVSETGHTLRRIGFITIGSNKFQTGDKATYLVAASNTALTGLANGTQYNVQKGNSTGVYLSSTTSTDRILPPNGVSETGHSLTGETATAVAVISGAKSGIAHAGWVKRTVGTGGRAGRVHYETLVAMSSMTGDDEDTIMKDS